MLVGYILLNPDEVNSHRQLDALIKIGVDLRKIYQDKIEDGIRKRDKLNRMLEELQEGDIVVITELIRLGSSTRELLAIVEKIGRRGCNIISLKEEWFNTTSASGALIFEILSGIVQFEQDLQNEKPSETNEINNEPAKPGGRPKKSSEKVEKAIELYKERKLSVKEIEEVTGVSKATLYRYLKEC